MAPLPSGRILLSFPPSLERHVCAHCHAQARTQQRLSHSQLTAFSLSALNENKEGAREHCDKALFGWNKGLGATIGRGLPL
uniref:Uncharacterized protein n=1 Tax=Knipowitschia caucasica TaxID=637954 RepID=A0AAV2LMY4_KNICA